MQLERVDGVGKEHHRGLFEGGLLEDVDELVDAEDRHLDLGDGEARHGLLHGVVGDLVGDDDCGLDAKIGDPRGGHLAVNQTVIDVDELECHDVLLIVRTCVLPVVGAAPSAPEDGRIEM